MTKDRTKILGSQSDVDKVILSVPFYGYLGNKTGFEKARIKKVLDGLVSWDGADGKEKITTWAEYVEELWCKSELKPEVRDVPRYSLPSRARWNRMNLWEQMAAEKRVKEGV